MPVTKKFEKKPHWIQWLLWQVVTPSTTWLRRHSAHIHVPWLHIQIVQNWGLHPRLLKMISDPFFALVCHLPPVHCSASSGAFISLWLIWQMTFAALTDLYSSVELRRSGTSAGEFLKQKRDPLWAYEMHEKEKVRAQMSCTRTHDKAEDLQRRAELNHRIKSSEDPLKQGKEIQVWEILKKKRLKVSERYLQRETHTEWERQRESKSESKIKRDKEIQRER